MTTTTRTESAEQTQLVTEVSGHEVVPVVRSQAGPAVLSGQGGFDLSESLRRIPDRMYFRIGSVAELLEVKPYVLRYWESEFPMISPQKSASGQRVYRRTDVETVILIKHLLYHERYSIEGARKKIRELRKEGELRTIRSSGRQNRDKTHDKAREKSRKVRTVAQELCTLIQKPVADFFRY